MSTQDHAYNARSLIWLFAEHLEHLERVMRHINMICFGVGSRITMTDAQQFSLAASFAWVSSNSQVDRLLEIWASEKYGPYNAREARVNMQTYYFLPESDPSCAELLEHNPHVWEFWEIRGFLVPQREEDTTTFNL